ncbi:MAG: hypothetical protein LBK99_02945, partial [Opitutaceae bacterium]|nr:hypothetical protein [Opitutaceae bacterium]
GTGFQPVDGSAVKRRLPAHLRVIHCKQLSFSQTNDLAWWQRATLRVVHGDCQKKPVPLRNGEATLTGKMPVPLPERAGSPCHFKAVRVTSVKNEE